MEKKEESLLGLINSPLDLKGLSIEELIKLSEEIRNYIIDVVSSNEGHLGASLGVVELTLALHYVFNTPYDQLVWDVGHQAYTHKIITGRRDLFTSNRQLSGISGFPKMSESEYDSFGGGHSSISISAALGMAIAAKQKGEEDRKIVAVIGDGSLSGGVAFEGLNNAGIQKTDILVILNDNNIAIDPNVGALKEYLIDITTSQFYNKIKKDVWNILGNLKKYGNPQKLIQNLENAVKSFVLKRSNLFQSLKFRYFGPVDGHDLNHLIHVLEDLKNISGPKLLHCVTKKGKGLRLAELNQTAYHAPGKFDKATGEIIKKAPGKLEMHTFQQVFGESLMELALNNNKIVAVTPAMPTGSSLTKMMQEMPDRVFDVGIAEQHAVSFSAGMAAQGLIPFCTIYSTFFQRAYDQMIHDVAIQQLPVVFCVDRAGLVGSDGPTHHGAYDIAFSRCIPGITIAAPMDEIELRNMMFTAQLPDKGPFMIRYPKSHGIKPVWRKEFAEIPVGKGRIMKEGEDIAIISIGYAGVLAQQAISMCNEFKLSVAHYDARFVKPLDEEMLHQVCKKFKHLITVEDGSVKGGFGSAVLEFMNENGYKNNVSVLGIPDRYIEQGTQKDQYRDCGFDAGHIYAVLNSYVKTGVLTNMF